MKILKILLLLATIWLLTLFTFRVLNNDKVAVVVTDWGQPEGFFESYYEGIAQRSAYIFNGLSRKYDPIFDVLGGQSIQVDWDKGIATFDTQVLGIFVIGN